MPDATTYSADQIRAEIKKLIANVTEREPDEIPDNAHYMDELGVDSLMAMEVMIAVDRKFGVDIPEEEFNKASNVNESVAMVERWLAERAASAQA
jgi:acyl carrier protein